MTEGYKGRIGNLIRDARKHRGLTQHQLAELLATSQSAINRIEKGHQNLSLEKLARIEEVNRLLEVLGSLGVHTKWLNADNDLEIIPPKDLDLSNIDEAAARRTRSVIMFLGPLLHRTDTFELPYAGGCNLGTRTVEPHMAALRPFGLEVKATDGSYHATVNRAIDPGRPIVLTERGDTVTENALMAAALHPGV